MGKMICRYAVAFEQNMVDVVFGKLESTFNQIGKLDFILNRAVRAKAQHIRNIIVKLLLYILNRSVTPDGIFAVIAEILFILLLSGTHS